MVDANFFYDALANKSVLPIQQFALSKRNTLNYLKALDISSPPCSFIKTKLMCTIGPQCKDLQVLEHLILAGMDIAVLNVSYASRDWLIETMHLIRQAESNNMIKLGYQKFVAIAIDIRGPTIRMGHLDNDLEIKIKKGDSLKITVDKAYMNKGNANTIYVDYDNILRVTQPDDRIYIANGTIECIVTGIHGSNVIVSVECDGVLMSRGTVFLPGITVDLPAVPPNDREDIHFGAEQGVDFIIANCVRNAHDIRAVREALGTAAPYIKVIAKIENFTGVSHIDRIIDAADGVILNRRNLAVEIPAEKVFLAQKSIINKCNAKGKPVYSGKEVLVSMADQARSQPSSAEAVDIANAVLDGIDGLWLAETGTSNYPVECVKVAATICVEAEAAVYEMPRFKALCENVNTNNVGNITAMAVVESAYNLHAAVIIAQTKSGAFIDSLCRYKPRMPVIAITNDPHVARHIVLYRGVFPSYPDSSHDKATAEEDWNKYLEDRLNFGILMGKVHRFIQSGDPIVLAYRSSPNCPYTDVMRIEYVSDIVKPIAF